MRLLHAAAAALSLLCFACGSTGDQTPPPSLDAGDARALVDAPDAPPEAAPPLDARALEAAPADDAPAEAAPSGLLVCRCGMSAALCTAPSYDGAECGDGGPGTPCLAWPYQNGSAAACDAGAANCCTGVVSH